MNAEEGYCERRREWAVLRGLSVVYCQEAETARTGLSWTKINGWKNRHTRVHTNTHLHMYKYKQKTGNRTQRKESICMSQVIRVSLICSVTEFTLFWPIGHQHFYRSAIQKNAAERYIRQQGWPEMLHSRTGCHELKDRLYIIKYVFPEVCKHTWICPLI